MKGRNFFLCVFAGLLAGMLFPPGVWGDAPAAQSPGVKGVLSGETTWELEQSPVDVTGHILVPEGSRLQIKPGVRIEFKGYYHLMVKGTIEAIGESGRPIIFTCEQESPRTTHWKGLVLYGEKCRAIFSDCVVEHAFRSLCWKTPQHDPVVFRHTTFRHNNHGLYFSNTQAAMVLKCRFHNNRYGIYCDYSSPTIQGNLITNNGFGVYCIFSSAPLVGQNTLEGNVNEDVFLDDSMGKNALTVRHQYVWSLVRGLF